MRAVSANGRTLESCSGSLSFKQKRDDAHFAHPPHGLVGQSFDGDGMPRSGKRPPALLQPALPIACNSLQPTLS